MRLLGLALAFVVLASTLLFLTLLIVWLGSLIRRAGTVPLGIWLLTFNGREFVGGL